MKKFAANLISVILIPLLAPVYLFSIEIFYFSGLIPDFVLQNKFLSIVLIFSATTILPFIFVFILYKLKNISSLTLEKREDRFFPQLFSSFVYIVISFTLIFLLGIRNTLSLSMISVTVSLILITFLTSYWKISTHSSGAMGMLTIISILFYKYPSSQFLVPYLIILFLMIYVCYARYYLRVHTLNQVLAGCLLGLTIGITLFLFTTLNTYR